MDAGHADASADACVPRCGQRVCGADGCGGVCGRCPAPSACVIGQCIDPELCGNGACDAAEDCSTCAADCACPEGQDCVAGACEAPVRGAPRFLTLNTNVRRLTAGETVTFSAVVTDPDGIDDLIGGVLEDANSQTYGAFVSSGQEGAYSMTVAWGDIDRIASIEFEAELLRTFVAVFFDQGGLRSRREIQVELHCDGVAACAGACADLADDAENCGACGRTCPDDAACSAGDCACTPGFFDCGGDRCVPPADICDREADCADGRDEAGCCFDDDACDLGTVCDNNRCQPGCRDNSDCAADLQCRAGGCVPGCARDGDCHAHEYCGADNRCAEGCRGHESCDRGMVCVDRDCREGCLEDRECGDGGICDAFECTEGCRDDRGCPLAFMCLGERCLPGCRGDDRCADGQICTGQQCRAGCRADDACDDGEICVDQQCRIGCRADAACDRGEICEGSSCIAGCRRDDACEDDQICTDLLCVDGCRVDPDCPDDRICRDETCVPGCQEEYVCPRGQRCGEAGQCIPGCVANYRCPPDERCHEGFCAPACEGQADCAVDEYCLWTCLPHVCGDGRLGPAEECDEAGAAGGCTVDCRIALDLPRHGEMEPFAIQLVPDPDDARRFTAEVVFQLAIDDAIDTFDLELPSAGVLVLETRSWTGAGCEGDPQMLFRRSDGQVAQDLDNGDEDCAYLTWRATRRLRVPAGVHRIELTTPDASTGHNLLRVEFTAQDVGDPCVPGQAPPCPDTAYCAADARLCVEHRCGDGVLDERPDPQFEPMEACDDGNDVAGDGCEGCRITPIALGNACVPGGIPACADDLACEPVAMVCVEPVCGDGFAAADEQCDDGNPVAADGCNVQCRFDPYNGAVEPDGQDGGYALFADGADMDRVIFQLGPGDRRDYFTIGSPTRFNLRLAVEGYPDGQCPHDLSITGYGEGDAFPRFGFGTPVVGCPFMDTSRLSDDYGSLAPGSYRIDIAVGGDDRDRETGPYWLVAARLPTRACEDGEDNDGDGLIDGLDPGCQNRVDDDELDPPTPPQCSDGIDNDGDGVSDFPDELQCDGPGDDDEWCGRPDGATVIDPAGGVYAVDTRGGMDWIEASCEGGYAREAVLRVSLDAPARIVTEVEDADFDTVLSLLDGCDFGDELACDNDGGQGQLSRLAVDAQAGDHSFIVQGYDGAEGTATVRVTIEP